MVLRKLPRNPSMESVDLFRRLDDNPNALPLHDSSRVDAVIDNIRTALVSALHSPTTVSGWRAQAMFASLVAALDGCELMTLVDTGEIYFDGVSVKAPDYFLCLRDGRRLLVDVKSVNLNMSKNLKQVIKFSASEIDRLQRFAELYGSELHIAIYVPDLVGWYLIPAGSLDRGSGGGYRLTVEAMMMRNSFAILGDYMVGTLNPLVWEVSATRTGTDAKMRVFAGGQEITSASEKDIVRFFMLYGGWEISEDVQSRGGRVVTTWTAAAEEINPDENFEMLGNLSAMYSRMFELGSSDESGPSALDIRVEPGVLISLIPHDYKSPELPLWRFELHPS